MVPSQTAAQQPIIYTRPVVYVVVPAEEAGLRGLLVEWFADDPGVEVIVERRSGAGRRRSDLGAPGGADRRLGQRRVSPAQSDAAAEGWSLPWAARRHAARLQLVLYDVPVHGRDAVRLERMLIDGVRGGDGAAADELYARHFDRMHGWAQQRAGAGRADELTQRIFDSAFAQIADPGLDARRLDRWLTEVAHAVAV